MNKSKEEVLSDYFEKANLNTEIGEHFFTLNILCRDKSFSELGLRADMSKTFVMIGSEVSDIHSHAG